MQGFDLRITELVNVYADGNVSKFAKMIGLSEGNVRNYIKGGQPKLDVIFVIVTTFRVSAHWLITGEGRRTDAMPEGGIDMEMMNKARNAFNQGMEMMLMNQVLQEKNKIIMEKERFIQTLLQKFDTAMFSTEINAEIRRVTLMEAKTGTFLEQTG